MAEKSGKPKIRFAGFTEDWEQRKLGEICSEFQSGEFIKASDIHLIGNFPVFGGNGLRGYTDKFNHDGEYALIGRQGALCGNMNFSKGKAYFTEHAIAVKSNSYNNTEFIFHLLGTMNLGQYSGQSAQPGLAVGKLLEIETTLPSIVEQARIGTFFRHLDRLITLHQRKRDRLVNIKKAMLEKMFPKNGADVPEVRFAGFTEAWEQRKLGDLAEFLPNNTFSRAELSENGRIQNVHYGDVLIKFGEVLDVANEQLPFVAKTKKVNKISELRLKNGDIVFADAAEDKTVGKCTELFNIIDKIVISGLHTIPCRPKIAFATAYLGYFFNSPCYRTQLLPLMQGIKVLSLSKTALLQTDIFYPTDQSEQARIGTFFRNLDRLITLHQRKVELLQNIKKACLETMFV